MIDVNFTLQNEAAATSRPARPPIEIRDSVQEGKMMNEVRPVYPPDAKNAGLQGTVRLTVGVAARRR